jgi:hypothetical protein
MIIWGAIEPVESLQTRLRLDFGLRPAILALNEWAVPGLGGAFFVRQLTWGCIGIRLAGEMNKPLMAARVAEALEAFASWIALKRSKGYDKDDRVQGKRKFSELKGLSFDAINAGGAYVTVPFRRAATAALPGLGFCVKVEARFNSLRLAQPGTALAQAALSDSRVVDTLRKFIERPSRVHSRIDDEVKQALLPGAATHEECALVKAQLMSNPRRARLAQLLERDDDALTSLQTSQGKSAFLNQIADTNHRAQLDACFAFERVRSSALNGAQALADCIKATSQTWASLAESAEVRAKFGTLERCCGELAAKLALLQDVPSEIKVFCNEQDKDASLDQRIRALATRLPLVLSVFDHGLDRGLGYTDSLVAADAGDATEGEVTASDGAIPRPLLRLKRLYKEILIGAPNAT